MLKARTPHRKSRVAHAKKAPRNHSRNRKHPTTPPATRSPHHRQQRRASSYFQEQINKGYTKDVVGTADYPFVSAGWLKENLAAATQRGELQIINASWQIGYDTTSLSLYQSFLSSRIPSALHLDIEECSDGTSHKPLAVGKAEQYAASFGRLGISQQSSVVLYDYNGLLGSAYVHFMLTSLGLPKENIRILRGGWLEWIRDVSNPVVHDTLTPPPPNVFSVDPNWQNNFVPDHEMFDLAYAHHVCHQNGFVDEDLPMIIDTRSALRYSGLMREPLGFHSIECGHIPGSVNVPYSSLVKEVGVGPGIVLKTQAELFDVFAKVGIHESTPRDQPMILTSGTGATASVGVMALRHMGFRDVRLYESGWLVYGYLTCYPDSPRPIEVGDSARLHYL